MLWYGIGVASQKPDDGQSSIIGAREFSMSTTFMTNASHGERLNNREAADYLGLKAATLNKWRCHGDGPPFIKVGRLIRYRRSDLDAFLMGRVRRSTSDQGTADLVRTAHPLRAL